MCIRDRLLRDRYFLRYALAIGCVYSTYFPFISESSSLLQRGYQLTATEYALVFAATISGYMLGANLFRRLVLRFEPDRLINAGIGLNVLGSFLLAMATLALPGEWLAIVLPMVVIMVSVGMVIPACQLSVLQPYGAIAGTASGLFFFIQMILTAVSSWVTGLLSDGTSLPLVIMTAAASALLITSWLTLHKTKCGSGGATTRLARDSGVSVR